MVSASPPPPRKWAILDLIELDGSTYGLPDSAKRGLGYAALVIAGLLQEAGPVLCGKAEMAGALDKEVLREA